jgi:hypothetical protein
MYRNARLCPLIILLLLCQACAGLAASVDRLTPTLVTDTDVRAISPPFGDRITLVTTDRVITLAEDGTTKTVAQLAKNQRAVLSPHGTSFGIMTYGEGHGDLVLVTELAVVKVGEGTLWRLADTGQMQFAISDDGSWAVGIFINNNQLENTRLAFYDRTGKKVATKPVPWLNSYAFSDDGTTFYALSGTEGLMAFDRTGTLIVNLGAAHRFAASSAGDVVLTTSPEGIAVHTGRKDPSIMATPSLPCRLAISDDGKLACVAGLSYLYVVDINSTKVVHRETLVKNQTYRSVDITPSGDLIALGISIEGSSDLPHQERYTEGVVRVIKRSGQKLLDQKIHYDLWNVKVPHVQLSDDGEILVISTRREVYFHRIPAPGRTAR